MRCFLLGAALSALLATGASAQVVTSDEIVRALTPSSKQLKAHSRINDLSLEVIGPDSAQAAAPPPPPPPPPDSGTPRIMLSVSFDFGSAAIKPESVVQLRELANALSKMSGRSYRFAIIGHTDAKGSDAQNLRLSVLRGAAVFEVLTTRFSIAPTMLFVQGRGKRELRDSGPDGAGNRRVDIVTLL